MKNKLLIEVDERLWQLRDFDFDRNKGALEPVIRAFVESPPVPHEGWRKGETLAPVRVLLSVKETPKIIGALPKTVGHLEFYFDYVADSEQAPIEEEPENKIIQ